jgi:Double-GTPase 1
MSSEGRAQLLLSGLPASGKTTFLAALWQVFETDQFESALSLDAYLGDQRYIVELNRAWANCEELARTQIGNPGLVRVRLQDPDGELIDLEVPDLSGEAFRLHWAERRWDVEFDTQVKDADGVVLMMNTLAPEQPLLSEVQAAEAELAGVGDEPEDGEGTPSSAAADASDGQKTWSPSDASDQVQMVEHLQFVAERREENPLPVAVVLSAWDQVLESDANARAEDWLRQTMPLLNQYLGTNPGLFPSKAFGVSAQGGDLKQDHDRLLQMNPIDRLIVAENGNSSHDLTLPLAWLVSEAKNA